VGLLLKNLILLEDMFVEEDNEHCGGAKGWQVLKLLGLVVDLMQELPEQQDVGPI